MSRIKISEGEWSIMLYLWEHGPETAASVVEGLEASTGWKPSTVKTMLARLVEKGVLGTEPGEKAALYRPLVSKDACARSEAGSLLARFFDGSAKLLVSSFIDSGELDDSELAELKALIERRYPEDGKGGRK